MLTQGSIDLKSFSVDYACHGVPKALEQLYLSHNDFGDISALIVHHYCQSFIGVLGRF
jgi:hypothetical protein